MGIAAKNQLSPNPKHHLMLALVVTDSLHNIWWDEEKETGSQLLDGVKQVIQQRKETEATNPRNFQRCSQPPLSYNFVAAIIDGGANTPKMQQSLEGHLDMPSVEPAFSHLPSSISLVAADPSTISVYCISVLSSSIPPSPPKSPALICHPSGFLRGRSLWGPVTAERGAGQTHSCIRSLSGLYPACRLYDAQRV